MTTDTDRLRRDLRDAGLSDQIVRAAWPSWWSDDLTDDPSGRAELRFTLARKLGLSPRSLIGERVEFIWNNEARFKHLATEDITKRAALSSFGVTIGRLLLSATPTGSGINGIAAATLRKAVLKAQPFVDLGTLLSACWGLGIPVIHLKIFPLSAKSMHAMVISWKGRHAILLGRDANYQPPVAFTLAHEMGHAALNHLGTAPAIVDMEDPAIARGADTQEAEADDYALTLLTGRADPIIETSAIHFNAPTLAGAILAAAKEYQVEPGMLALCLAYQRGIWPIANAAIRLIYGGPREVWRDVNRIAAHQLDWTAVGDDASDWIRNVMGIRD